MKAWTFGRIIAGFCVLVALAAACDSPVDPEDHAGGAVFFRADGTEAARFVFAPRRVTGQLEVGFHQTVTYRVQVLTEGGELVDFDGSEYSIHQPHVVNDGAATVDLQGADQLAIFGLNRAETTMVFQLQHGGHAEFEVRDVPLVIQ